MSKWQEMQERLERARCYITSSSDEYTEAQVAVYRAVDSLLVFEDYEYAEPILKILERMGKDLLENPGYPETADEIRERLAQNDRAEEPYDHWGLL